MRRLENNKGLKKADFMIVQTPTYVEAECPYCELGFQLDCDELADISSYPGDWEGQTVECPNCEKEIIIDDVDWD